MLAPSQSPSSIVLWSGRCLLSVGATPASASFSSQASSVYPKYFSAPGGIGSERHSVRGAPLLSCLKEPGESANSPRGADVTGDASNLPSWVQFPSMAYLT